MKAYATSKDGKSLHVLATHSFRRTGISKMSDALNGNVFDLKQYSGHKTVRSLEIYVQKKNKEKIAEAIEDAFR